MRLVLRGLLDLLFPPACLVCGQALGGGLPGVNPYSNRLCPQCQAGLTFRPTPVCPHCAADVGPHTHLADGCPRCRDETFHFERVVRLGSYEGVLRDVVLRMKLRGQEGFAELLGSWWAEQLREPLLAVGADAIVPVPLHWRRRWRRGFNQSAALARGLAGLLRLPLQLSWLRRVRYTPPQTTQTPAQRRDNVRGVFRTRRRLRLHGLSLLLIDDVMTTGATVSECARTLRAAGAARVVVAVLTRGS
jgi:ComF family protein